MHKKVNKTIASLSIKQWKEDDRPREKMLLKGKSSLSDAELLTILIGSGTRKESALSLSKRILVRYENNLNALAKQSPLDLMDFKGIGKAKSISIITALELGRRRIAAPASERQRVNSSRSVYELMQPLIGELSHEEFWIIYLNNANKIQDKTQLSIGGITATLVDVRLIFKKGISLGATSIILCHNHPSGNLTPSSADIQLTEKIIKGGKILDIKVLDHIIISEEGYYSFADENQI
jgi:DNA repair protein RadC